MNHPPTIAQSQKKAIEFFQMIKEFEVKLYAIGIENRFPDPDELIKFKKFRLQWSFFVDEVQIDITSVLVNQLQQLEKPFEDGIKSLEQEVEDLKNTVDFLNLLGNVLGIIGKIVDVVI
jgi:hypothetical protein